jgi:RNA polymerase sigma factor (sigma-70 family)
VAVDTRGEVWPWRPARARELEERIARQALSVARRTALGVLGDPAAADDVAQDVALIALRRRHRLKDPDRLDAWLHRVATRAALRHGNRASKQRQREEGDVASRPVSAEADTALAELLELLAPLPLQQRAALTLRYVHDLPDAEIARALGCREGTVRSLLSRGRAALRETLESNLTTRTDHA